MKVFKSFLYISCNVNVAEISSQFFVRISSDKLCSRFVNSVVILS